MFHLRTLVRKYKLRIDRPGMASDAFDADVAQTTCGLFDIIRVPGMGGLRAMTGFAANRGIGR